MCMRNRVAELIFAAAAAAAVLPVLVVSSRIVCVGGVGGGRSCIAVVSIEVALAATIVV